jgi:PAS domain S-box-containing protein
LSRKYFPHTIRSRLYCLLLTVLVPFLLLQVVYFYSRFESRQSNEFQANVEMARAVAGTFNEFVQDVLHQELAICINLTMHRDLSADQMNQILEANRAAYPAIRTFAWISPEGRMIASSMKSLIGEDIGDRPYIREIKEGKEWTVSDLLLSRGTGEPVFSICRGVRDREGRLLGIILAGVKAEKLCDILELELSKKGTITILDSKGMVVDRYPKMELKWEDRNLLRSRPIIGQVLEGREVIGTFPGVFNGEERIVAYSPSRVTAWIVSVGRSRNAAMDPIKSQTFLQAGFALFVTAVVFLIAFFLSHRIADPIRRLREHALILGRGNLTERIEIRGVVELEDLAASFNVMAGEIGSREDALRRSEEEYRELVENANSIVLRMDFDGTITFFNEFAQEFFGYAEEDIIGCNAIGTIFPSSDSAGYDIAAMIETIAKHPELYTGREVESVRKHGERVWVMWSNKTLRDGEGNICGILAIGTDITARKRAEDALRESEREKVAILGSIRDVAVEYLDPQMRIIWSNSATNQVFNRSPEQLKGRHCYEAIHGLEWPCQGCTAIKALETGEPQEGEVVHPDGRAWLVASNPIKDSSGKVTNVLHAAMNITRRKAIEAALSESEERYRGLVESQSDLVVRTDLRGLHVFVNEAYCHTFGKVASDFMGERFDFLIHSEDLPRVSAALEAVCEPPFRATLENRNLTVDGVRWFHWEIAGIRNREGKVVEIQGVGRDVTERKYVEQALRTEISEREQVERMLRLEEARLEALWQLSQMAESSMEQIAEFSLEQQVKLTRSEIGCIGFLDENETSLTMHSWSKSVLEDRASVQKARRVPVENAGIWADAIRERRVVVINDYSSPDTGSRENLSGPVPLSRIMIIPVFENDRVVAIAGVGNKQEEYNPSDARQLTLLMDGMWKIMQREKAEKTLRESETLTAMGRALAAVAHDMKTPLIAIGGFTRLVQRHIEKDNPVQSKLEIVIKETIRLENMVKDMLDFSRPLHLDLAKGDVCQLVNECLSLITLPAREKRITLSFQSEAEILPASLDFMRMKQVLINLVTNAIQASPRDGEVIIRGNTDGNNVLIDVIDFGCGIPADKKQEIFSPFYTTKKEGTGLGLPIVKKIVETHRGRIEILDNPEGGTTFRVVLPIE